MTETNNSGIRVTKLLELAQSDPKLLQELEKFRRTLVVMFSDIRGSTAYFEKYGDAAGLFMVHQCNDTVRRLVEKHGGAVIKTIGDGTMATFPQPKGAVEAAIEIQVQMAEQSAARKESERIGLRIGMHYGSGIVRTKDVFGDVVNMASRVENVASAGQIVLSEETYTQVRESGFNIRELGRFTLKGKTGERTLYQVIWQPGPPVVTEIDVAPDLSAATPASFRLQVVGKDGAAGAEYSVQTEVAVGLSKDGKLIVSNDFNSPLARARIFVQDGCLFVERCGAGEAAFLRLANPHALDDQDIFLAGKQIFRYEEKPSTSAKTAGPEAGPAGPPPAGAELVRIDNKGNAVERYPLDAQEIQFGRTRGTHVFSDDNLMSRSHIRILQRGDDFVLEDLGSRNGTFLKLQRRTAFPAGSALMISGQLLRAEQ